MSATAPVAGYQPCACSHQLHPEETSVCTGWAGKYPMSGGICAACYGANKRGLAIADPG